MIKLLYLALLTSAFGIIVEHHADIIFVQVALLQRALGFGCFGHSPKKNTLN